MKALFITAAFCLLLLGGLLRGEQSGSPPTQAEEIAQLRNPLPRRGGAKRRGGFPDQQPTPGYRSRPQNPPEVPPFPRADAVSIERGAALGSTKNSSENGTVEWEPLSSAAISCPRAKHPNRRSESSSHILIERGAATTRHEELP